MTRIDWTIAMKRRIARDQDRGVRFLHAMTNLIEARLIMEGRGYTPQVHRQGFELLFELLSSRQPWEDIPMAPSQKAALEALGQWDAGNMGAIRTTLENIHSEQAKYLFHKLEGFEGKSLFRIKFFLARTGKLRDGTDPFREESREADRAAVALLEARHLLDRELERRLAGLVEKAEKLGELTLPGDMETDDESYLEKAERFHEWLTDWRETARSVIKNQRHLVRLGLKSHLKKKEPAPRE